MAPRPPLARLGLGLVIALALAALPHLAAAQDPEVDGDLITFPAKILTLSGAKGCGRNHDPIEYIYVSPKIRSASPAGRRLLSAIGSGSRKLMQGAPPPNDEEGDQNYAGWFMVAEGKDVVTDNQVYTGDEASVTVRNVTESRRRRGLLSSTISGDFFEFVGFNKTKETEGKEVYTGTPIDIRSATYILSFRSCGFNPVTTVAAQTRAWFNASGQFPNIQDYFKFCTYDKLNFKPENNPIFQVDLPCSGSYQRGSFTYTYDLTKACGASEMYSWFFGAEEWARNTMEGGQSIYDKYQFSRPNRRIIMLIPNLGKCRFTALGSIGCSGSSCPVFLKGAGRTDLGTVFHELGHTVGLAHATRGIDEYGDTSDIMGDDGVPTNGYLCTAVGSMYRVGWATPIADLSAPQINTITTNTREPMTWRIPPTSAADVNMLRLNLTDPSVQPPSQWQNTYLVSMRRIVPGKYDSYLTTEFSNKVFIHAYNGTPSDRDYFYSNVLWYLKPGGFWYSPQVPVTLIPSSTPGGLPVRVGGGIRVDYVSQDSGSGNATVRVCWTYSAKELNCEDGIDDDCDGLLDLDDPDCQPSPPPRPPPPLKSPPPRRNSPPPRPPRPPPRPRPAPRVTG